MCVCCGGWTGVSSCNGIVLIREKTILINMIIHSFIPLIHTFIEDLGYDRSYDLSGENKNKQKKKHIFFPCNKKLWDMKMRHSFNKL